MVTVLGTDLCMRNLDKDNLGKAILNSFAGGDQGEDIIHSGTLTLEISS